MGNKYNIGDIVNLKIESQAALVIECHDLDAEGYVQAQLPGYTLRLPNYDTKFVSEFELL